MYSLETCVLFASGGRNVEGTHTGFLQNIMGERSWRLGDKTWEMPGVEGVQEAAGMQLMMTYTGRRH